MSDVRQRADTRNGVHFNGASSGGELTARENTALQQQIAALTQKIDQMDLNQQVQLHDLRSGNRDLGIGVQAIQALQAPIEFMSPIIQSTMAEGIEAMIAKNADGFQFHYELTFENGDE